MAKGLRNAALLGGAALLAAKMMGGSKDRKKRMGEQDVDAAMDVMSRPDMDTTADASAGMAKTNMDDFARKTQQDIDARIPVNPRMSGRMTAGQEADAAAAAKNAAAFKSAEVLSVAASEDDAAKEITNKQDNTGTTYSQYGYDIAGATKQGNIYPSLDPAIFEVRYPNTDIQGRVVVQ